MCCKGHLSLHGPQQHEHENTTQSLQTVTGQNQVKRFKEQQHQPRVFLSREGYLHLPQCSEVERVSLTGNGVCQHREDNLPQMSPCTHRAWVKWQNCTGEIPSSDLPGTWSSSGWSGNLTGICATLPVHHATAGHQIPTAQPRAGEGNS